MAEKTFTEVQVIGYPYIRLFKWTGLQNGDTGKPLYLPKHADKSVQVVGTFGAAGNCRIEGSNMDGTPTYGTLVDPQGNALDITTSKIEAVLENTYIIRPNITGGDGTTALDVYLLLKS